VGAEEEFKAIRYVDCMMKNRKLNESLVDDFSAASSKVYNTLVKLFYDSEKPETVQSTETTASSDAAVDTQTGPTPEEIQEYIENLSTETVDLKDALAVNPNKTCLFVGSSQADVMGPQVLTQLQSHGFIDFKYYSAASKTLSSIVPDIARAFSNKNKYDIIVIYPSYKMGESAESVVKIARIFEPARCFFVIPPPVTTVLDTQKAEQAKINKGRPVPSDFWFKVKGGRYASEREKFCADLRQSISTIGASYIDPRDVIAGGEEQPTGIVYPSMEDGIHPSDIDSLQIATDLVEEILNSTKQVSAASVVKKITPEILEQHPEILEKLGKYPALKAVLSAASSSKRPVRSLGGKTPRGPMGRISRGPGRKDDPVFKGRKENHQGLDIAIPVGTPVVAALDGVVNLVGDNHKAAGNYVDIKHANGDLTRYLHLSEIHVEKGQSVSQGEVIGLTGGARGAYGSGKSTGPHLHWETWRGPYKTGQLLDPRDWLASNTDAIKPVNFA
jgi:murein DD-endopeptidase MepM/ murein hydrolase activator NlpD